MEFLDRQRDKQRLLTALSRERRQFVVLYGRRRIGKSTLIKQVLNLDRGDIYYLADATTQATQRQLLASLIDLSIPGFAAATYSDWESLLLAFNRQIAGRVALCLDEFPNLVKSCPSLPSVLQRLIDNHELRFDLIICGSSQQMMQGLVLDSREPLYGRADEIIRLDPIDAAWLTDALGCDARQAVSEYAVWGGVPRYWELRADYPDCQSAVAGLLLDPHGPLYDEPSRLLRDEMRDTVQASTLLTIIGSGASRVSEIAARAGRQATDISPQLARLRQLGFISKSVPFGESELKSRKSYYSIVDPLLRFHYRFVMPYKSILEVGRLSTVQRIIAEEQSNFESRTWEQLCQRYVTGNVIAGVTYGKASGWWGSYYDQQERSWQPAELDVVAESIDRQHLLIGECKWTDGEDAAAVAAKLARIAQGLSLAQGHQVHLCLFLKSEPKAPTTLPILLPAQVLSLE